MAKAIYKSSSANSNALAAKAALVFTGISLLAVVSLHFLSPELAPSWRMVSEYAYGQYEWVLALMFITWGLSSWALAVAIWSQPQTKAGKIGLWFLLIAGCGEVLAAIFDIRNDAGHTLASFLGMGGLPIAALLISRGLRRTADWASDKTLRLLTHGTWISVVLLILSMIIMTAQFMQVTGSLPEQAPTALPEGVVGLVGYANRLIFVAYYAWVGYVAWRVLNLRRQSGR